jgi:AcrR family transcriptional regulator
MSPTGPARCAAASTASATATGTEEIVASAGVTRGALYYQFADKQDVFRAVFTDVLAQVGARVWEGTMAEVTDDKEDLIVGTRRMLAEFARPDVQRILLLDGPVVLGWSLWRDLQRPLHLAMLTHALEHLVEENVLPAQPLEPLADVISGAILQASLAMAASSDEAERAAYEAGVIELLARFCGQEVPPSARDGARSTPRRSRSGRSRGVTRSE